VRLRAATQPGFSLVELLVVLVVACGLLTAAWGWFWTVNERVQRNAEGADASTSLAFARRLLLRELRATAALAAPAAGQGCGPHSLALVPGAETPSGLVQYTWDPARQVLWRASSSSHVADGVTDFLITYYDAAGRPVEATADDPLNAAQLSLVRSVDVRIALCSGPATTVAVWTVALRTLP
jgi:prepilin-type N-terminal cleavage/methylation domain-containing protein